MFINVVACIRTSFLFKVELYSIVWIYYIFFIHSSVDGHVDCFDLLAIVDNTAMISVQISV